MPLIDFPTSSNIVGKFRKVMLHFCVLKWLPPSRSRGALYVWPVWFVERMTNPFLSGRTSIWAKLWAVNVDSQMNQVNIIRPRLIYKIPGIDDVCYEITKPYCAPQPISFMVCSTTSLDFPIQQNNHRRPLLFEISSTYPELFILIYFSSGFLV